MSRPLIYYVAASLDGFIAREDGSFSDFPWDEDFGAALFASFPETFPAPFHDDPLSREQNRRFDAVLMGRRTYEVGLAEGITNPYPSLDQYVFSGSMESSPDPSVRLVSEDGQEVVRELKAGDGKAIWLCGGSILAAALLEADLIDGLIVKLNPVLLGGGIPIFASRAKTTRLTLTESTFHDSGHAVLEYDVGQ